MQYLKSPNLGRLFQESAKLAPNEICRQNSNNYHDRYPLIFSCLLYVLGMEMVQEISSYYDEIIAAIIMMMICEISLRDKSSTSFIGRPRSIRLLYPRFNDCQRNYISYQTKLSRNNEGFSLTIFENVKS